ncbi:MAG: hypothetical protein IJ600_11925 [Lachnospiraceae bacterium]|nr:hypothetical protein [Lachnospiraceae bacterium]
MVNRVDGQHNYTNPYERRSGKAARVDADAPAFLLDYDEKGVIWERSQDTPKGQIPKDSAAPKQQEEKQKRKAPRSSVKEADREAREQDTAPKGHLLQSILQGLRGVVHGFLQLVWYSSDKEETAGKEGAADRTAETGADAPIQKELLQKPEKEASAGEESADPRSEEERIREKLAQKDQKGFMDILTRGNQRKPARNTSILTAYDRRGRLVKPDDAQRGRLLRGEQAGGRDGVTVRPQGTYRKYI